jgi:hypothetical protein
MPDSPSPTSAGGDDDGDDDEDASSSSGTRRLEAFAESLVRITLAGVAGSVSGLALERRGRGRAAPPPPGAHKVMAAAATAKNLPLTWAASCMMFVSVLETCRVASPTSRVLDALLLSGGGGAPPPTAAPSERDFGGRAKRAALAALGDYAVGGGAAAGLAGALGRRAAGRRRPAVPFAGGLRTGFGLGLAAGLVQAGIDVGNLYIEREQQQQRQQEELRKKSSG